MRESLKSAILIVLIIIGCLTGTVRADDPFDGRWASSLVIERGPCIWPPGLLYYVRIARGRLVTYPNADFLITGRVEHTGVIRASGKLGDDKATAQGRLLGDSG